MSGSTGWLFHTWGRPWEVHGCADEDGTQRGDLLHTFSEGWAAGAQSLRPEASEVAAAIGSADPSRRKRTIRLW